MFSIFGVVFSRNSGSERRSPQPCRNRQRGRRTRVDPQLSQCVLIDNNSVYAVACSVDVGSVSYGLSVALG